jgi:hypothetical protein
LPPTPSILIPGKGHFFALFYLFHSQLLPQTIEIKDVHILELKSMAILLSIAETYSVAVFQYKGARKKTAGLVKRPAVLWKEIN